MSAKPLSQAILRTLQYSDLFNFPLTSAELHLRLTGARATPKQIIKALETLVRQGRVIQSKELYALKGSKKTFASRRRRARYSRAKLRRARTLANFLILHPSILGIYATGSLAVGNARVGDDIDIMIITKDAKLWQTRALITLALDAFRLRRRPGWKKAKDKYCLNIFLTPAGFTLPKNKRNLYSAYELTQIKPLRQKRNALSHLLAANPWIRSLLPNFPLSSSAEATPPIAPGSIEKLLYSLQHRHMKGKITNETVSLERAFFHPRNLASDIMRLLEE